MPDVARNHAGRNQEAKSCYLRNPLPIRWIEFEWTLLPSGQKTGKYSEGDSSSVQNGRTSTSRENPKTTTQFRRPPGYRFSLLPVRPSSRELPPWYAIKTVSSPVA